VSGPGLSSCPSRASAASSSMDWSRRTSARSPRISASGVTLVDPERGVPPLLVPPPELASPLAPLLLPVLVGEAGVVGEGMPARGLTGVMAPIEGAIMGISMGPNMGGGAGISSHTTTSPAPVAWANQSPSIVRKHVTPRTTCLSVTISTAPWGTVRVGLVDSG